MCEASGVSLSLEARSRLVVSSPCAEATRTAVADRMARGIGGLDAVSLERESSVVFQNSRWLGDLQVCEAAVETMHSQGQDL